MEEAIETQFGRLVRMFQNNPGEKWGPFRFCCVGGGLRFWHSSPWGASRSQLLAHYILSSTQALYFLLLRYSLFIATYLLGWDGQGQQLTIQGDDLERESANFFGQGPDSKCFSLCGTHSLLCSYLAEVAEDTHVMHLEQHVMHNNKY